VSHEKDASISIQTRKYGNYFYGLSILVFTTAFIFYVSIPIQQNTLLPRISNAEKRGDRIALYPSLTKLKHAPVETLRSLGGSFTNETARRARELQEQGLTEKVKEEYGFYIEAYKTYYTQYENNYRYLIEHGRMINSASIFKIDELKYGEELLRKALDVSTAYPHAYWLLAENLYYQGKLDEALETAREGYDIDPSIKQSIFLYEFVQKQAKSPNSAKSFIYISDL
jgi:tetratricopeptide (TPR) repeat protein